MKLTKWFGPEVKPVRFGAYETSFDGIYGFSWFDGKKWGNQSTTPYWALSFFRSDKHIGAEQDKTWRGLAEKPE